MDTDRFDAITRLLAARRTRRAALGGIGLATAALMPLATGVAAQDATPEPFPDDPHPSADTPTDVEYLFVQSFLGGTWTPKAGEAGTYTLALAGATANTIYFSDRPERDFGLTPTGQFLDRLGFTPADPPNAAVVTSGINGGDQEVLVVELLNPNYDESAQTLTYDARVLADYAESGLAYAARQQTDFELPEAITEGSLFIDGVSGCEPMCATCYQMVNGRKVTVGDIHDIRTCGFGCDPCDDPDSQYYGRMCHEAHRANCSYTCDGTHCTWDCFAEDFVSCLGGIAS